TTQPITAQNARHRGPPATATPTVSVPLADPASSSRVAHPEPDDVGTAAPCQVGDPTNGFHHPDVYQHEPEHHQRPGTPSIDPGSPQLRVRDSAPCTPGVRPVNAPPRRRAGPVVGRVPPAGPGRRRARPGRDAGPRRAAPLPEASPVTPAAAAGIAARPRRVAAGSG